MIGDEKTYEFIDKMFASLSKTFTSRKLHIGLDEAHNVGRGKYLDKNGYRNSSVVMCEHIDRVVKIAKKYGFEPMMWADMFFRLANNGAYYVGKDAPAISKDVIKLVPEGLRLVYWDYYQDNQEAYENMIERCKAFGKEVVFAGGAWSWRGFAPRNRFSDIATNHAFNACRLKEVKNVFLTMWGDDGAECSPFATLSSLSFASDYAYGIEDHEGSFVALTGMRKEDFLLLDAVNDIRSDKPDSNCLSKVALYNDVFLGIFDGYMEEGDGEKYGAVAEKIYRAKKSAGRFEYVFDTIYNLARVLKYKAELGVKTRKFYQADNKKALKKLASKDYTKAICCLEEFYKSFEKQWYIDNKSFGFEVQTMRLGGLLRRLNDCKNIVLSYADGSIKEISELESEILEPSNLKTINRLADFANNYKIIATTSVT